MLISVRQVAFYAASWCSLSPDCFERLRTQLLSYFYFCGKVRLFSTLRSFLLYMDCSFDNLLQGVFAKHSS
nr:MAG TPA: hypothetical protein [Caudoviricetes sp.]